MVISWSCLCDLQLVTERGINIVLDLTAKNNELEANIKELKLKQKTARVKQTAMFRVFCACQGATFSPL